MASKKVDALVEGGKATPAPPLGPSLAPLGINVGKVVADINAATKEFAGMRVPVKIMVDTDTKAYTIEVGTPPVSSLIKNLAKLEKLAQHAGREKVADLRMEQIIKIVKMKEASLPAKTRNDAVKCVLGTCLSGGVLVEGKDPRDVIKDVDAGIYNEKIKLGKTELTAEELKAIEEEKKRLAADIEAKKKLWEETGKNIIGMMKGHVRSEIVKKLAEAGIPSDMIDALLPKEAAAAEGAAAGAAAPAAGAKAAPGKK